MEAIAGVASVVAILQVTDRIIQVCRFFIDSAREDAPAGLRNVFIEISGLKTLLESLQFLETCDSRILATLCRGNDSPIEHCNNCVNELEKLLPPSYIQTGRSKPQKRQATLATLAWPFKESKAKSLLEQIARHKSSITLALAVDSAQTLQAIEAKSTRIYAALTEEQHRAALDCLQKTDPSSIHYQALRDYETGTCEWACKRPEWAQWLDRKERCLWIHGIPGAGKTVLMSYLIQQTEDRVNSQSAPHATCVYYYCYFARGQGEAKPFLRWLISRLCRQTDFLPEEIHELYRIGREPSLADLLTALAATLISLGSRIVYVLIDALDESQQQNELLDTLSSLVKDERFANISLIASSREYSSISDVMHNLGKPVSMNDPIIREDIARIVGSILRSNNKFKKWPQQLLTEVEETIPAQAQGMIRWAVCQLDLLQRLKPEQSIIRKTLATLPKTIFETYERIMDLIAQEDRLLVYHTLRWISLNNEVYAAVHRTDSGVANMTSEVFSKGLHYSMSLISHAPDQSCDFTNVREICGCMIRYSQSKERSKPVYVSFAHYTVREYLDIFENSEKAQELRGAFKPNFRSQLIALIFRIALGRRTDGSDKLSIDLNNESLVIFCQQFAMEFMQGHYEEILENDILWNEAMKILDPLRPKSKSLDFEIYKRLDHICFPDEKPSASNIAACQLFQMIVLVKRRRASTMLEINRRRNFVVDLGKRFLQRAESGKLFQSTFTVRTRLRQVRSSLPKSDQYVVKGTLIEVLVWFPEYNDIALMLLRHPDIKHTGLSGALVNCIELACHFSKDIWGGPIGDLLNKILEAGADPSAKSCYVTPLQIACASLGPNTVKGLLEAGADANGTGNASASASCEGSPLVNYNILHGKSPLLLCQQQLGIGKNDKDVHIHRDFGGDIPKMLLEYGARSFEVDE